MLRPDLKERINSLPRRTGVYLFRGAGGEVLYVGKAVNLRSRVRSYFQSPRNLADKILHMVNQIEEIETIATATEVEALILESNLVKRHQPPYNIRLRDDKHYPYLKVTVHEPYPRVLIARSVQNDGARYFGPYTDAGAVRETLKAVRRAFPYRTCSNYRLQQPGRPCLYYHIGRCLGPCDDLCTRQEYDRMIEDLCEFLAGRSDHVVKRLEERMREAADRLDFEQAADLRDQVRALRKVLEKQQVISGRLDEQDVVGQATRNDHTCVQVFFVREGRVVGREHFMMRGSTGSGGGEILAAFLKQYYGDTPFIPREILVAEDLPAGESELITAWLSDRRGSKVFIRRPQRGDKRRLMELVAENAVLMLNQEEADRQRDEARTAGAVHELAGLLALDVLPERIECYDISNIQGQEAVGSMVVFTGGRPAKGEYRRFKIRTVRGADDFAMMQEVLFRRFRRHGPDADAGSMGEVVADDGAGPGDEPFSTLPDLIIIDGGKGQLNAAMEVLRAFNLDHIATFGLAKRFEHLFAPGRAEPIELPDDSSALHLLQRLRDEAHRFAVTYHRKLRTKGSVKSVLDDVPGIGLKRRNALLKHFGTIDHIRRASLEDLAAVPGMNLRAARALKERL